MSRQEACPDCGCTIDPDWCWCGARVDEHTEADNHGPIPMGCDCRREPQQAEKDEDSE